MSIIAGDILKIVATLLWTDGNLMQNVFAAVVTGGGSPWDDDDIVDDAVAWMDAIYAHIVAEMSDACDGSQVQVYVYDPLDEDFDEVGTDPWTFNPSSAGSQLPRGVAALINANTLDPDIQGKKYFGGLTEGAVADGLYGGGFLADLADVAAEWIIGFVGATSAADWQPGVWSPTEQTWKAMSGAVVIPTIPAYQRRRKRGVGA